ncbi:MAG: hypothetical protein AB1346_04585 [Thermodesulfobacteriota bacterium]
MTTRRFRFPVKALASLLAAAFILSFGPGPVSIAQAAEPATKTPQGATWETWPRKPIGAGPGAASGAAAAGEAAGAKTFAGISAGTWGWIAGGAAAAALVGVAAGGGGGGSSTVSHH